MFLYLCALSLVQLITASDEFTCPAPSGNYENPIDCSSYYVCVNGEPVLMPCPTGLLYDSKFQICNEPENVECKAATVTTPSPTGTTPTTSNPTVTTPTTSNPTGTTPTTPNPTGTTPTTPNPTGTAPTIPPSTSCPTTGSSVLPNPADCGSFFYCKDGISVLITCPLGFEYSTATGGCINETESDCSGATVKPPYEPDCSTAPNGSTLPDLSDCTRFFTCSNGFAMSSKCPPGLEFNPQVKVCDTPEHANCHVQ